jgi:DNA-binding winged helix-turn-helix (wHTH) protein
MSVRFGDFSLDRERRVLTRGRELVPLPRKAFDFLELLVLERPRALSKERIKDRVWPRTFVSESTLNSLVAEVRAALGDDARAPRYIRTAHRFGYAFAAEASEDPGAHAVATGALSPALLPARLLWEERVIPLSPGENLVGRGEDVGIRVDAPSVSRHHARITVVAGEPVTIEDLGSKNGTWLGDHRIEGVPATLRDRAVVRLGKVELVFLESQEKGSTQTVVD